MTPARARPFDRNTVQICAREQTYQRARDCLQSAMIHGLSWEWEYGTLVANAIVGDPSGDRLTVTLEWDGEYLSSVCACAQDGDLCAHGTALALHLLRVNPWRQEAPRSWQAALSLALPPQNQAGFQRFIYYLEVRAHPGSAIGRLRLRLTRARTGKRGLGRETPFPADRLRSTGLEGLPTHERSFLSWLMAVQSWTPNRAQGYVADPRFLEIPPPLVDIALRTLARSDLAFFSSDARVPLHIAEEPLQFQIHTRAAQGGGLRMKGTLVRNLESTKESMDPAIQPELILGENPSYALLDRTFHPVENLPLPELWALTRGGEIYIAPRDLPDFFEHYSKPLQRMGLLLPAQLQRAAPEVLFDCKPEAVLTLEEHGGKLMGLLSMRYGEMTLVAGGARDVEEVLNAERRSWIQRDRTFEAVSRRRLIDLGFRECDQGQFEIEGELALSFLLDHLTGLLADGWIVEGEERLEHYKISHSPVRVRGSISSHVQWFALALTAEHKDEVLPMSEVFRAWREGRRFIRFDNGEAARLPEAWLQRNQTLLQSIMGVQTNPTAGTDAASRVVEDEGNRDAMVLEPHLLPLVEGIGEFDGILETDDLWAIFHSKLQHAGDIDEATLPAGLHADLRAYQHRGVNWITFLREEGLAGILADDMGLGKTIQALTVLLMEKERLGERCGPSLVVAPTSVLFNWQAEASRFTPDLRVLVLQGPERHQYRAHVDTVDLVVTSYALLRRDIEFHLKHSYHYAILDEAQWVKNPDSQTALAVRSLHARHRLTLTGTPIENRLSEIWSQFAFLLPTMFPDLRRFVADYAIPIERDDDQERRTALWRRINPFILRRLKEEVASELPPRTTSILFCEFGEAQRRLYEAVLSATRDRVRTAFRQQGKGRGHITALDALLKLRQVCCDPTLLRLPEAIGVNSSAKRTLFQETLIEILAEKHRVLVFSQFVGMLSILRKILEKDQIDYEYLDGRTRDRQGVVDRFNAGSCDVFLISLKAGGTGLNLASADYVIHYDPWWNPAVEDQATDRAYRIGQTRPVFSYKLIVKNTVEEKILQLQERKRILANGLLTPDGTGGKRFTAQDLEYLFDLTS